MIFNAALSQSGWKRGAGPWHPSRRSAAARRRNPRKTRRDADWQEDRFLRPSITTPVGRRDSGGDARKIAKYRKFRRSRNRPDRPMAPICLHSALVHNYHNLGGKKFGPNTPACLFSTMSDPEILNPPFRYHRYRRHDVQRGDKIRRNPETMAQLMVCHQSDPAKTEEESHSRITWSRPPMRRKAVAALCRRAWLGFVHSFLTMWADGSPYSPPSASFRRPSKAFDRPDTRGAREMDKRTSDPDLMNNPAYLNAVIHYLLDTRKNKSISVMMPLLQRPVQRG